MVISRIRKGARPHVYLREWRKHKGLRAEAMAERLEIERESYYRLERNPGTLSVAELIELADALGVDQADLWHLPPAPGEPEEPSVDAMLDGAPQEQRALVIDLARRVVGKAS